MNYRIGTGYDIHRLVDDRKLFIGGVQIPYAQGLLGHSDGDLLLHSICDAMLGAAGEEDIGQLFPDTDPKYHNASSAELLKKVNELINKKNFSIINIDTVIVAQEPILSPFKSDIKNNVAKLLGIKQELVNLKAKTNEKLGEIGRGEAIACWAVVLLNRTVSPEESKK